MCNSYTSVSYTWEQGQDAAFTVTVPMATSSWTVVMTFDKAITTLNAWNGVLSGCTNGTVCSYTNKVLYIKREESTLKNDQNQQHFVFSG